MNTDEQEWRAQERALSVERKGDRPVSATDRERQYQYLARRIAQQPVPTLPTDFARHVARLAEASRGAMDTAELRFQWRLIGAAVAAMLMSAVLISASFGIQWLSFVYTDNPWLRACVMCVAISEALKHWQRTRPGQNVQVSLTSYDKLRRDEDG